MALLVFGLFGLFSAALGGTLYDVGTSPFCSAGPQDCTDRGDTFVAEFTDSCWTGNKVWCRRRDTVKGQVWVGASPFCETTPQDCEMRFMKHVTSARCGDGSCCVSGTKQLCVPKKEDPWIGNVARLRSGGDTMASLHVQQDFPAPAIKPKLSVWLGSSPFCNGKCKDCALYGMTCNGRDKTGDGDTCLTGRKAMCVVPDAPPLWAPTQSNILKVLSYNVRELGFMYVHDGQRERTCQIPRRIVQKLGDVDVIVFQEVFMGGCFPDSVSFADLLRYHGFLYMTKTVGTQESAVIEDGGVFIASRWPIVGQHELIFEATHYGEADAFAAKGAIYAKVMKTVAGSTANYHIIGTHMQAQIGDVHDEVREAQAKEMRKFMQKQKIPFSEPVIYAGDFNCDILANRGHVRRVLNYMGAGIPKRVGKVKATFDPRKNDMFEDKSRAREWLDYVVFSTDQQTPLVATLEGIRLRAKKRFHVCKSGPFKPGYIFPNSPVCPKKRKVLDLSDHYPVLGVFIFP
ncbi:sphingomyelinase C-like [Ptychodera flava]|uniref:sphingomyelinase C-like n=1 Tax=Ptychodera flava TaxID=63121 RepID=UPI00396A1DC1